jgi:NitT/TauT family transport system substrate-binding protein
MGEATGPVPFTSYMTTPAFLRREPDVVARFTRAVYRTQRWLASHDAAAIAAAIAPTFPGIEAGRRERIVARFLRQDTWARDPLIRRPSYEYLQEILLAGGLIRRPHPYEELIDTAFAEAAVQAPGG